MDGSLTLFEDVASEPWDIIPRDPAAEYKLQRELTVPPLVAACLVANGYTDPVQADLFLRAPLDTLSDPRLLPDYEPASKEILGAIERKEKIYVHGDYDVDGISSAAILTRFLRSIGADVEVHVPHRIREGYGIHMSAVEEAQRCGAKLFLTCDCGTSANDQIEAALAAGMRVVVTDHHEPKPNLPQVPIINPHREGSKYPFPDLCGAGVVFQLCAGLTRDTGHSVDNFHRAFLDLVTLGTVADVMPLVGENRILVRHGLPRIWETKKIGLRKLMANALKKDATKVTARDVGFGFGPRLNAAGRIDDADVSLRLLLTSDEREAEQIASALEKMNQDRRAEEARMVDEAIAEVEANGMLANPVLVVAGKGWHPGIIGLVAGRLQKKYHRPSFALGYDPDSGIVKGSARSVKGFHLADALQALSHVVQGGGHELAAGFSGKVENIDLLRESLQEYAKKVAQYVPSDPQVFIHAEVATAEADKNAAISQELLEPFGTGNPEPTFLTRNLKIINCKPLGDSGKHVKLTLEDGEGNRREVKGWGYLPEFEAMPLGTRVDMAYTLGLNQFRGNSTVEWQISGFTLSRR